MFRMKSTQLIHWRISWSHHFQQRIRHFARRHGHAYARVLERGDLCFGGPFPPLTIAPAWPIRRPGGAVAPAINPATGLRQFFLIHSAASSSAEPPISPIIIIACVSGSSLNILMTSRCDMPGTGSPPIPTHVLWPTPREVNCQTASYVSVPLRETTPTWPFLMDIARRDADTAAAVRIFPVPGCDDARTIRADQAGAGIAGHGAFDLDHIARRNAFGDADHYLKSGVHAFQDGVRGKGRGNKDGAGCCAGLLYGFGHCIKYRNAFAAVLKHLAAFAGRHAGDDLRAVIDRKLRVFGSETAGDALDEDFGIRFN